jgi:hypothetical protein
LPYYHQIRRTVKGDRVTTLELILSPVEVITILASKARLGWHKRALSTVLGSESMALSGDIVVSDSRALKLLDREAVDSAESHRGEQERGEQG